MRAPGGSGEACVWLPSRRSSSSRERWIASRAFDSTLVVTSALSASVVSRAIARSNGTSGLSGADSTRDICTACARLLVGSMRTSAMNSSHTFT